MTAVAPALPLAPTADPRVTLGVAPGVTPALRDQLAAVVVADALEGLPRLAATRRSLVARLELEGRRLIIKRYLEPGAFLLRSFLRASRARREHAALRLVADVLGEAPAAPVAWAERRVLGFVPRSWLVTVELEGSVSLRRVEDLDPAARARVVDVVRGPLPARVAALHRARVFARNLHAKNVLVAPAAGTVAFIDLPAASTVARLGRGQRLHDLACLWKGLRRGLGRDELLRFLDAYARDVGLGDDPAALAAAVWERADALDNATPLAALVHGIRRRLRHTRLGEVIIGHRYAAPPAPDTDPRGST